MFTEIDPLFEIHIWTGMRRAWLGLCALAPTLKAYCFVMLKT